MKCYYFFLLEKSRYQGNVSEISFPYSALTLKLKYLIFWVINKIVKYVQKSLCTYSTMAIYYTLSSTFKLTRAATENNKSTRKVDSNIKIVYYNLT